jgi:hypothetical protein
VTSDQPLLKLSVNETGVNKSVDFSEEQGSWTTAPLTRQQLLEHIYRGKPSNPCLFKRGLRSAPTAFGGNTVYLDMDDGIEFDRVVALPVVQMYGALVTHSASSGVVSEKEGVDGRDRLRIIFALEEEVATDFFTEDEVTLKKNTKIQHLERCALTNFFADQVCEQLGIPKMIDNTHNSISQMFYGNDGVSPVEWKRKVEGGGRVIDYYPCSIDRRYWIGEGFLPKEDQARIVEVYRIRKADELKEFEGRSEEELSEDALVAKWIFDNDILDDRICQDRNDFIKIIMAAKSISEDLFEPMMRSLERFDDGHHWRTAEDVERCFNDFHNNGRVTIRTLTYWATECCPEWRRLCPYTGGIDNPPPRLSPGVYHLKGFNPTNIII